MLIEYLLQQGALVFDDKPGAHKSSNGHRGRVATHNKRHPARILQNSKRLQRIKKLALL